MLNNERVEPLRRLLEDPEFQGLVDDGNWKKIYSQLSGSFFTTVDTGTLTELLLESGIEGLNTSQSHRRDTILRLWYLVNPPRLLRY